MSHYPLNCPAIFKFGKSSLSHFRESVVDATQHVHVQLSYCLQNVLHSVSRDLGFNVDANLTMTSQVANVCRSAYYHLSRIAKIRDSISTAVCKSLIHGLVTSRLDYGNAILYGISDRHMHRLEMVQRSAARIVRQIRRGDRQSMTTILRQLHWLPVRKRIDFKLLVLVHRAIYNGTPEYLAALLRRHTPTRSLRSAGGLLLEVPRAAVHLPVLDPLCGTNFQGTYVTTLTLHSSRSN